MTAVILVLVELIRIIVLIYFIQAKATELLNAKAPNIDDLKACLNTGIGMDATIKLPELPRLRIVGFCFKEYWSYVSYSLLN